MEAVIDVDAGKRTADGAQRAYARLDVTKDGGITEDGDYYYIRGIATTPTPDRIGDIVDPTGAKFTLPLPLLWQHDSSQPIGNVVTAKSTKNGIPITAQIPKVKEAGILQDRINQAVQSIKYGLVAGLSIGFRALDNAFKFLENGGIEFQSWEWMELSVVTIPANAEATIQTIKKLDKQRTAPGAKAVTVVRLPPRVGGQNKAGVFRLDSLKSKETT